MDRANGQLEKLKISITKYLAARTVVEQAANVGPMFKGMKSNVKQMDSPNASMNRVYCCLEDELNDIQERAIL